MANASEHLRGPWLVVIADRDGFAHPTVDEAIKALGEDGEVMISVVRGTAAPTGQSPPLTFNLGDIAHEVDALLVDPGDESLGAHARVEQAKAMAAGLNAAGQSTNEPGA